MNSVIIIYLWELCFFLSFWELVEGEDNQYRTALSRGGTFGEFLLNCIVELVLWEKEAVDQSTKLFFYFNNNTQPL